MTLLNGHPSRLHQPGSMDLHHQSHSSSFSRPSHPGAVSQSHFEVHISPTAFSPIIIPSHQPAESATTSPRKHRDISPPWASHAINTVERTPRVGEVLTHGRSQSSVSPNETHSSRARSRRHGIPANFLESVGAISGGTKTHWNGQSLGAEQSTRYHAPKDSSPSSFPSQPVSVHPSASAPVTSCLSNADAGLGVHDLVPIRENSTEPGTFSSSNDACGRFPLPRSISRYNLANVASLSSRITEQRRTNVNHRSEQSGYRSAPPPHLVSDESQRHQRSVAHPLPSSSPTREGEATVTQHTSSSHHSTNISADSETEIGYKGLAFPLPPSSEEGLAVSYSSSQSSVLSTVSARRSGDLPLTPKKSRDGKLRSEPEQDTNPVRNTQVHGGAPGSGWNTRERNVSINVSESRVSPTPNPKTTRKIFEAASEDFERVPPYTSRISENGERDTIRHQERAAKELENVLNAKGTPDECSDVNYPPPRVRAVSETPRPHPTGAHPPKQPEPTKPLVLNSSRKTLHTTRSFATLADRKQIHASSSGRELAGPLKSTNGRSERVPPTTAIPMRMGLGMQRDRDGHVPVPVTQNQTLRSEDQTTTPPSLPLPTPPNSSSSLTVLANETTHSDVVTSRHRIEVGMPPSSPLTLEEVTEALRTHHVRFDELAGHVLDMAQQLTTEKNGYVVRVERLEGTVAKLEREIRGLRWLVLENTKARDSIIPGAESILDALTPGEIVNPESKVSEEPVDGIAKEKTLRRSSTMPHLPTLVERACHARNKRFRGLGLDSSPESAGSSPLTPSSLATPSRYEGAMGNGARTPSMDEIIDKLMAVRQWAGSEVRVSVVESNGDVGDSKRIVFRQV